MTNHNLPIRTPDHATPKELYPWLPRIIRYEDFTLSDFYNLYRKSDYGQWHATQRLRFAQDYPYDEKQMLTDLGDDVDPVEHSWYTLENITLPFIDAQQKNSTSFTQKECMLLVLTTLLHDIGECTHPKLREVGMSPPGDVSALDKTHHDVVNEERIWRYIAREIWPHLPQVTLDECSRIVFGSHKLSEDFNTIERIGYFTTGVKAARRLYADSKDELHAARWEHHSFDELRRRDALGALATRVCNTLVNVPDRHGDHYQVLRQREAQYPYVAVILKKHGEFAQKFITGEDTPYGSVTKRAHAKAADGIITLLNRALSE